MVSCSCAPARNRKPSNPPGVLVAIGFDVLRQPAYRANPFDRDYMWSASNVWRSIAHPLRAIEDSGGAGDFVANEIFPWRGLSRTGGQFEPNITLHLLGEGMVSRKLGEWYAARRVPAPYVAGVLTMAAVQFLNEVVENGHFRGPNRDPVADLLLFNVAGWALFAFEPARRFFSGPLRVDYWPDQAAVDLRSGRFVNVGENAAFKIALPWTEWRLFFYSSIMGLAGLSIPLRGRDVLSMGIGGGVVELVAQDVGRGGRSVSSGKEANAELGIFWDRDESLLASLKAGGTANPHLALNVYPGLFSIGSVALGAFVVAGKYEGISAGLTVRWLPLVPTVVFARDTHLERL